MSGRRRRAEKRDASAKPQLLHFHSECRGPGDRSLAGCVAPRTDYCHCTLSKHHKTLGTIRVGNEVCSPRPASRSSMANYGSIAQIHVTAPSHWYLHAASSRSPEFVGIGRLTHTELYGLHVSKPIGVKKKKRHRSRSAYSRSCTLTEVLDSRCFPLPTEASIEGVPPRRSSAVLCFQACVAQTPRREHE